MAWYEGLTENQLKEIALSYFWRDDLGTYPSPGATHFALIAQMADMLKSGSGTNPLPPGDRFVMWDCDYHGQWDPDAQDTKKDCGPTAVEIVCKYVTGNNDGPGTDEIMEYITGGYDRPTSLTELQRAAKNLYGVTLKRYNEASIEDAVKWIDAKRPPIFLVKYGYFVMRLDRKYTNGHFMVGVGRDTITDSQEVNISRIYLHDPDWWQPYRGQGAFLPVTLTHFYKMWDGAKDDRGEGWQNPARAALVPVLE